MEGGSGEEAAAVGGGVTATWLEKHRRLYDQATRHPFILSIRDGTIDISAFKRWLRQDYLFVREFVPFLASVMLKARKDSDNGKDMEVILGGMASLHDELAWFKKEASKWGVSLDNATPQKANQDYCRFLQSLTLPVVDYTIAIVAFWAIETVYQESFALCLEEGSNTPLELMDTCQRWGNADFRQYCHFLREIANRRLEKAPVDVARKAEEAFIHVLEHEVNFWYMSTAGT